MANSENSPKSKHFSGFWPIFIVVIVAAIAAFTIYLFATGNILQDQIYSTSFFSWGHQGVAKKTSAKLPAKSTVAK